MPLSADECRMLALGVVSGAALHWWLSRRRRTDSSHYRPGHPWWIMNCHEYLSKGTFQLPPVSAPLIPGETSNQLVFGAAAKNEHFMLEEGLAFCNHGSYGATLRCAMEAKEFWSKRMEAQPVRFMVDEVLPLLSQSIRCLAQFVSARPEDIALVPNATTAVNAVVKSLPLQPGDVCLTLDISYGAVKSALHFACSRSGARMEQVVVDWPFNPDQVVESVKAALRRLPVKFCIFDHITSMPCVLLPVARLTALCRQHGVLCMVDGAHAVGSVDLNFNDESIGADFYTSNCHKWLMTPKGTAFLWVKPEYQQMVRPTVISWGYSLGFACEFMWAATADYTPFLGIPAAIEFFRRHGPKRIREYNHQLAVDGGALLAKMWNTDVLVDPEFCSSMCMVRLPSGNYTISDGPALDHHLRSEGIEVLVGSFLGQLYCRISGQIYVELSDYERLGEAVLRVQSGQTTEFKANPTYTPK